MYTHFTLTERIFLYDNKKNGLSIRRIAEMMGRSPSSVSRELKRNRCRNGYRPLKAESLAKARRRNRSVRALKAGSAEYKYVIEKLKVYWSPEAICGRWSREYPKRKRIHFSTIYRHIKQGRLPDISENENLRRRGKLPKSRHGGQMTIHPNRLIKDWPEEIKGRTRIGDWEGDTITGKIGSGLITTLVDRASRYLIAGKVASKHADVQRESIEKLLNNQPVKSLSLDNGVEFAEHEKIEKTLKTRIYFADPHSPWQRGTNENTNGLLRFFFPKSSDFREITQENVDEAVALLNRRPRKCLGWKTPEEVFQSELSPWERRHSGNAGNDNPDEKLPPEKRK